MKLNQTRVLIVEDDLLIARSLTIRLEEAGAEVVGPVVSAQGALRLLGEQKVDAAILDVNVQDGTIEPVAEWMIEHKVPLIFHTALGLPADLKKRHPKLPVCIKPTAPEKLIAALAAQMGR